MHKTYTYSLMNKVNMHVTTSQVKKQKSQLLPHPKTLQCPLFYITGFFWGGGEDYENLSF